MCLAEGVDSSDGLEDLRVKVAADGSHQVPEIATPPCRQIAVPTTLSAAEFSNIAGCTNPERGIKEHFTAPTIGPVAVILDPAACLHTPEWLWLSTGIRAVDHAVEGICSAKPQPFADAVSLHALRLFAGALPANLAAPEDLEARLQSQIAAWLAGSSIGKVPYGASHGIGHQLGAVAGVPHGHTSCVLLPAVLDYNLEVTKDAQAMVSQALGRPGEPASRAVGDFIASLGQPRSLREVGVERGQLSTIAEGSLENPWVRANPRPIDSADQVMEILEKAW
jgi:alcohol dehydrogenase class IV